MVRLLGTTWSRYPLNYTMAKSLTLLPEYVQYSGIYVAESLIQGPPYCLFSTQISCQRGIHSSATPLPRKYLQKVAFNLTWLHVPVVSALEK